MKFLLAWITVLLGAGCSTPRPLHYPTISFISDPPGAKIEIDGDYVGEAPCIVEYRRGRVWYDVNQPMQIVAYPTMPGMYEQRKFIGSGDATPHRVYFNMRMSAPPKQYDLHLSQ